jgi:glycosyltransferase involved in cell wall biosynthesis
MNAAIRIRFEISLWWNLRRVSKEFKSGDFDLVISCIPTVAAGIIGKRIAIKLGLTFGLIVQDLSGAGAKQSGIRGGALMSKVAHVVEASALKEASGLVVVSPAMRDVAIRLGVEESRISQILNYSARKIDSVNQEHARGRFGWAPDNFVVVHTGNMGAKQDLENVVAAALELNGNSRIKIYLVGHGNQESKLKSLCLTQENVSVMDAVSDEGYYSERPVLAAVPRGGATWKFLAGIAELVDAGKPELLARAIEELSRNAEKRNELASKGLQFAKTHLDPVIGRKKYLDWVENLIESKHG